jgi:hypothetical protein
MIIAISQINIPKIFEGQKLMLPFLAAFIAILT